MESSSPELDADLGYDVVRHRGYFLDAGSKLAAPRASMSADPLLPLLQRP
jgi:hypothetical protein